MLWKDVKLSLSQCKCYCAHFWHRIIHCALPTVPGWLEKPLHLDWNKVTRCVHCGACMHTHTHIRLKECLQKVAWAAASWWPFWKMALLIYSFQNMFLIWKKLEMLSVMGKKWGGKPCRSCWVTVILNSNDMA